MHITISRIEEKHVNTYEEGGLNPENIREFGAKYSIKAAA
jgi:hypothetical protein